MGETNFIKTNSVKKKAGFRLQNFSLNVDLPMLIAVIFLLVFGLVMVYSSSIQEAVREDTSKPAAIFQKQAGFVILGLLVAYVASRIDYHWLSPLAPYIMAALIVLLIIVLTRDPAPGEVKRTLFKGSVQPSELAKVVIIIYLSVWIGKKKERLQELLGGILPLIAILGVVCVLIMLQPDTSAMLTILILGALMFYIGEGDMKFVIPLVIFALIIFAGAYLFSPTVKIRLTSFLIDSNDWDNLHFHTQQALSAIIRGGWFGTNVAEGAAKYIGLPVPWTDSIFAVIIEETGIIGGAVVVFLYLVILIRGIKIAENAPDLTGKLLVSGLTCWIVFEAFLNMGVMVRLFPIAGNALPLISYGGSIMLTTLGSIGLIFSVNRATIENKVGNERRSLDAAVDLRGRDGRGRVSRTNRSRQTRNKTT